MLCGRIILTPQLESENPGQLAKITFTLLDHSIIFYLNMILSNTSYGEAYFDFYWITSLRLRGKVLCKKADSQSIYALYLCVEEETGNFAVSLEIKKLATGKIKLNLSSWSAVVLPVGNPGSEG